MYTKHTLLAATAAVSTALAQSSNDETVLAAYVFHRHGDRTPKILGNTRLTNLGYDQVLASGTYFNDRYISNTSSTGTTILGISAPLVSYAQLTASAPANDVVLQNSAQGFLQALYPPVNGDGNVGAQELRNGTTVGLPMNGYQLIPVAEVSSGANSENSGWLQDATQCNNAKVSSNQYFSSGDYTSLLNSTGDFYDRLLPVVQGAFNQSTNTFKNAYAVYDYVNVALIHNTTIPSSDLLDNDTFHQLQALANAHEWGLAYNRSSPIRAVAGMTLAAEITDYFNTTLSSSGAKNKLGIQFGAYGTFASFFGLAQLDLVNVNFTGVTDYASSMVFEMFTNGSSANAFPTNEADVYVRFLYHNGTASEGSPLDVYPLFNSGSDSLSWADFLSGVNQFALNDEESWCTACGNVTGSCAAYSPDASSSGSSASSGSNSGGNSKSGNGLSPAVNGVIGAFVTLGVLLLIAAIVLLVGGFRLVSKKRLAGVGAGNGTIDSMAKEA
ncbi:phosphoglycerate mutase-like protein [Polychaeton citri CBS 116435]|uniref:Phosphoglycerate mutase-like protein n=1 Tax=Polychaeton citri CBS 116435 TaxID=1314669 RepID=A0A9P4Q7N9_9PEZI|nr:phosphoglycerate mutase-like protein [Polychaeton citri CBS 116435]